jgi:hypothetical protein
MLMTNDIHLTERPTDDNFVLCFVFVEISINHSYQQRSILVIEIDHQMSAHANEVKIGAGEAGSPLELKYFPIR